MNVMDMPIVKTVGASGEFHHEFSIPNPPPSWEALPPHELVGPSTSASPRRPPGAVCRVPLRTSTPQPPSDGQQSPDLFEGTIDLDAIADFENAQRFVPSSEGLERLAPTKTTQIPLRMAAQTAQTDDQFSLGGVTIGDSRYYTIIIREHHTRPSGISCIFVEHNDNLHVLLKCNGNVGRKIDRILKDCGVTVAEWHQCKLTKVLVNNPIKMLRYFLYRGIPIIIGNDLRDEWELAKNMSPLKCDDECHGIQLRRQTTASVDTRILNRTNRYKILHDELRRRGVFQATSRLLFNQFLPINGADGLFSNFTPLQSYCGVEVHDFGDGKVGANFVEIGNATALKLIMQRIVLIDATFNFGIAQRFVMRALGSRNIVLLTPEATLQLERRIETDSMADCEKSSAESVDLDETLPLPGAMVSKREFKLKLKKHKEALKRRVSLTYKRLNLATKNGKLQNSRHIFRPSTNIPEIDMQYLRKSEKMIPVNEKSRNRHFVASSWDFNYPPNARSREHCSRIIYDALGQPDEILMKRTNSGYEVCEVIWHQRDSDDVPECFKNWDLLGRIEICLPVYMDTRDEQIYFEDTYNASFRLIDRHYEIFTTKDWRRTTNNLVYSLKELEDVQKRDDDQPPINMYTNSTS
ncbi:hypothetical protein ACTXT7_016860 [Hymenolepis weldensis]